MCCAGVNIFRSAAVCRTGLYLYAVSQAGMKEEVKEKRQNISTLCRVGFFLLFSFCALVRADIKCADGDLTFRASSEAIMPFRCIVLI